MTIATRPIAALTFLLLVSTSSPCVADTDHIGPSFVCPRPAPADGLSQTICDDPSMSREEMVFEQAYYALRQADGRAGWKALKVEAITLNTTLRTRCGIPLAGAPDQTMPSGAAACYIDQTEKDRNGWLQQLTGPAREEASRPIEQHIALQQRLVDLGYLSPGTKADGIYGETTRSAIEAWQGAAGRPQATGFLSDDDASALSASSVRASAPAAPAGADVSLGLHTSATVFACANPRATRALSNKADQRQNDPGWVAFVKSDGRCFSVSQDQRWEQISVQGRLLLLRRTPPVVGEPPLFFMPGDIQLEAPVALAPPNALAQPPTPLPDAAPAPTPLNDAATRSVTAPAQPQGPVQDETPAMVPSQNSEVADAPAPQSDRGTGAVIFLLVLIAVAAGIAARVYLTQRAAARRLSRALELAATEITAQQRPLRVRRLQLVSVDAYGTVDLTKWTREKELFVQTRIAPLLAAEGLSEEWPAIAGQVDHRIEMTALAPVGVDEQAPFLSNPEVFDPRMTPTDYELHCALLLRSAGWDAQTTVASGDQGTDVIARRGGVTLVLQCKLYGQPVGNSAVQEVSAARLHQQADHAAVVSNASYTAAAQQLARTNGVYLLHHEVLRVFDPVVRHRAT